jgi:soluble lytic murein transglycosylase-like protein
MRYSVRYLTANLIVFIFILTSCGAAHAELTEFVHKYNRLSVNEMQMARLSQFNHLIQYFCNFYYYVPNHKVNPDFIRALILAESGANPKAISNKNAMGLGQILYSTGKDAARELAQSRTSFRYIDRETLRNLEQEDLFDPAVNILLTCFLIAKYNYRFNGRLDLVVSAWNAGENTEGLLYGRHAPYTETEDLIGKINGYFVYLLKNRMYR